MPDDAQGSEGGRLIRTLDFAAIVDFLTDAASDLLATRSGRLVLGIAGGPGVGKSTLAAALVARINERREAQAVVVPMDGFHMRQRKLEMLGLVDRKGAPQTFEPEAFAAFLAAAKSATTTVRGPGYSRKIEDVVDDAIEVPTAARLLVVEGNYLLLARPEWSGVRPLLDYSVLLNLDRDVARRRLIARRNEEGLFALETTEPYVTAVDLPNFDLVYGESAPADVTIVIDTQH